jgi:diaminohydroxyphosphoribosylaminopyrimidine deaminase/5-amino-6-(5-phosphoribosylamino)uracil reductase
VTSGDIDVRMMARGLRLAALGRHASPNPMVGCVLTNSAGDKIGEGYHKRPGTPHAEVVALASASAAPHTAYVTLEPCSHHGRTPPCADALIASGVRRVVVALLDPDPRVAGAGIRRLRDAGVTVEFGLLADRARSLLAAYLKHRSTGLPWITLKTAMTLDGKIATVSGDSRWISSGISRTAVHRQLRDRADAILTGVGTVLADDPELTTRLNHRAGRNPWRIVVDSHLRTPLTARVVALAEADGRTILATVAGAGQGRRETFEGRNCQVIECDADGCGKVSLPHLARILGTRQDIVGVLAETGGALAAGLLAGGLIDRWVLYIAPKIAGGAAAPGPIGGAGVLQMADSAPILMKYVRRSGPDLVVDARLLVE